MPIIDPVTGNAVELVPIEGLTYLKEAERRHLRHDGKDWLPRMRHLLDLLAELKPNSYLDFGCSGGHFLAAVPVEAKYGFEPDAYGREKARGRGLTVYDRWQDVPTVDCISAIDVIEHLHYREIIDVLYQLRGKLRDGGHVLVQSDNPRSLAAHLEFYNDYTHVRMYDLETFVNLLNLTGFCTVKAIKTQPGIGDAEQQRLLAMPTPFTDPWVKWALVARKVL
jgi:hypothetical protein